MAKQVIDIGSGELTGDGETLRQAFGKVNSNFDELYADDLLDFDGQFSSLTGTPTTLAGYGITDAATSAQGAKADTALQPTDISITSQPASGGGALVYDDAGGFTYTPPDITSTGISGVVDDTTPELGGDLVTGNNRLKFSGTGGSYLDFTVTQYTVPNNTVLSSVGSINIFLDSASADSSGDTAFRIFDATDPDGAVTEANNVFKISDSGDIATKGDISVDGTKRIKVGANDDLLIFHNGNHSIIREVGTGSLYLQSDDNVILSTDSGTKKMIKGVGGGAVELYHNDILKLNTSTSGVTVVDEVHTEGATPHLTLKRTDNANVPTIRFKGSGGVIGASIDFDGTSGTSNELAFQVYDGATIAERFRVTHTGATVSGDLVITGDFTINGTTTTINTTELQISDNIMTLNSDVTGAPSQNAGIEVERGSSDNVDIRWNETSDQWEFTNDGTTYTALGTGGGGGGGISNIVEDTTPQLGGNLDGQAFNITTTGKMLYSNVYSNLVDLPSASTYHGMFAHVHATGAAYFAHGGNWIQLANHADLGGGGGLSDLVDDTTPQLGGNLDTNGHNVKILDGSNLILGTGNDASVGWNNGDTALNIYATGDVMFTQSNKVIMNGGGNLDMKGNNIDADNLIISTYAGNLQISSFNYVVIDSANDGQIEIGRASGTGDVIIGKESNGTSVSFEGVASFDERVLLLKGAEEKYSALTGATGTVAHDCANGKMFYHTTPAADWTVNLTNLDLNQYKYSTSIGIVVTQGNTAYIPNAVQIAGAAQTIIWQGNSTPTGTDNGTDAISFTIMRDGSTYIVLGQLTSFGGV